MVYSLAWMNCSQFQQQGNTRTRITSLFFFFFGGNGISFNLHFSLASWKRVYNIKSSLPKGKVSERNKLPSWFSILRVWTVERSLKKVWSHFHPSPKARSLVEQPSNGPCTDRSWGWLPRQLGVGFSQQFPGFSRETVLPMSSLSHSMFEKRIRQCWCFRQRYIL